MRYVLGGSVKRSGDDIRVNANLADAQTGTTIWSQQFDRQIADIDFLVQDDIVGQIVAQIAGGYGVIERTEVRSAKRKNPRGARGVRPFSARARYHAMGLDPRELRRGACGLESSHRQGSVGP